MKSNYLFPHRFKKIGWILFVPGVILGILYLVFQDGIDFFDSKVFVIACAPILKDPGYFTVINNNILDEVASCLLIVGAIFLAFSKEQNEDELIAKIRLESLVRATLINYVILLAAILFVYDMTFFWVLVFNIFTLLILFLVRFNWALLQLRKSGEQ